MPRFYASLWSTSLVVLALMAVSGCEFGESSKATAERRRQKPLVRVSTVEKRDVSPRVVVIGSVTPRWTSIIASGADGLVDRFLVEVGQSVAKGDVLSQLRMVSTELGIEEAEAVLQERKHELDELKAGSRPQEIAEVKAKMRAAETVRTYAANKLKRAKRLFTQNVTNQDELENAKEKSEAVEQDFLAAVAIYERIKEGPRKEKVEQARARYRAQQKHVKYLKAEKQKRTTTAPFNGYVSKVQTFVGQWLSKEGPVVTLSMLDEVDVVVNVDQWDLCHVKLGQTADVRVKGALQTDWKGKIISIVPRTEWQTGSRGFPVEVRVQNRFHEVDGQRMPVLKEGMMAEVTFMGTPIEAIMVPKNALLRTTEGMRISVIDLDAKNSELGTSRSFLVEPGISEGAWIQVLVKAPTASRNLVAGMQVVTEGAERLKRFPMKVRIAPELTGLNPNSGRLD